MRWIYPMRQSQISNLSAFWWSSGTSVAAEKRNGARQTKERKRLRRHSRHLCVRRRPFAAGLPPQHVLHVADEGGEPQGLQGRRGEISRPVSADAGPAR